jgi:hypothetical protein
MPSTLANVWCLYGGEKILKPNAKKIFSMAYSHHTLLLTHNWI